ncbi:BolA family transcriptional regulator [Pelagibacteraceae bacterium]|nr:BolA family transcriptional regulator [Pelagibacteraceae bacterium]
MNRTKRIKYILQKYFNDHSIIVRDNSYLHKGHNNFDGDNETHILVQIKKNCKLELSRLEIHRKINFLLSEEFDSGLHSLEIKII